MSASLHSPDDLRDQRSPETPTGVVRERITISKAPRRPVRGDGFGNRFPVLFDHRDDMPARELAHWGPAARYMLGTFLTVVILLGVAALAIAWYLM